MSATTYYDVASEPSLEQIKASLESVKAKVAAAAAARGPPGVRLVAASKTKSPACLRSAYEAGARIFGENYVQELVEKAPQLPPDVEWHFIGHLQSNKVKELVHSAPTLTFVETVDSTKLASKLDDAVATCVRAGTRTAPLNVMVQVNTSGEESKYGVSPDDNSVDDIALHIVRECPHLVFCGLMTIGMLDYTSTPANFECLRRVRDRVAGKLGVDPSTLDLSMGMSADYESAIAMGATNVRVGTSIFGKRAVKPADEVRPATPPKP